MDVSSVEERILNRQTAFKSPTPEFFKNRQNQHAVHLRRQQRKLDFTRRRNQRCTFGLTFPVTDQEVVVLDSIHPLVVQFCSELRANNLTETEKLEILREVLCSHPPLDIAEYTLECLRCCLTKTTCTPIGTFASLGFIPIFLNYCAAPFTLGIYLNASWCICNIAAGAYDYQRIIIELDGVSILTRLLAHKSNVLSECVVGALANLAGELNEFREEIVNLGVIEAVKGCFYGATELSIELKRSLAWFCSNMSRGADLLSEDDINDLLELIAKLITDPDLEVHSECIWTLAYLVRTDNEKIRIVINSKLAVYGFSGLAHTDNTIKAASIRLIGNFCSGTNEQTEYVLHNGFLNSVKQLVGDNERAIRKDTFFCISNIAAGSLSQLWQLLTHLDFRDIVNGILDCDIEVKLDASIILHNLVEAAGKENAIILQLAGYIDIIAEGLNREADSEYIYNLLEVCQFILKAAILEESQEVIMKFEMTGCYDAIQQKIRHLNVSISELALSLTERYFSSLHDRMEIFTYADQF